MKENSIEVKKLWKGKYVSLRDNWIQFGIDKGGLEVRHNGQAMFLDPIELKKGKYSGSYKSKYGKGSYKLYDFIFSPSLDTRQKSFL